MHELINASPIVLDCLFKNITRSVIAKGPTKKHCLYVFYRNQNIPWKCRETLPLKAQQNTVNNKIWQ
jgi:hypothetical protein